MSFNYSGDPADSDLDAVRFNIQDTDSNDQLLQDEEITYLLNQNGSVLAASVAAAERIATQFSRQADVSTGDQSVDFSQRAENYRQVANKLQQRLDDKRGQPYAGGISKDDKENAEDRSDRVEPSFVRGMHDNVFADEQAGD